MEIDIDVHLRPGTRSVQLEERGPAWAALARLKVIQEINSTVTGEGDDGEPMLAARGVAVTYEAIRRWCVFGAPELQSDLPSSLRSS